MVVAVAAADLALHVNVGQKIHFDAALAFTLAGFAASAGNVEGESSGLVATLARFGQHRKKVANQREDSGVSCGIGARSAADGRLIDANHFVDQLAASNGFVCAGLLARAVKLASERAVEDVIDERRFAGAGDSGDNGHNAERKYNIDILKIILARAKDGNALCHSGCGARAASRCAGARQYTLR